MQAIGDAAPPRLWPEGVQSSVALAFDVDGPTGNAMLDGSIWRNPSFFTLGAYGPWRAVGYLLDMLDEYRMPATFFVPTWVLENWPAQIRAIVERGHEIGYHGHRHEAFWQLTRERQQEVMALSLALFRKHLDLTPAGFRTPSGDWGADTIEILLDAGVRYSSSMRGDDRPYFIEHAASGRSLVEIPGRWELDDYASLAYQRNPDYPAGLDRIASYDATFDNWRREFDGSHRDGLCMTTLFHPKVSGKPGRILLLERLCQHMRSREGVWFARCGEVAQWWREQHAGARVLA
ncbi:polysaccharide deacetylase family protein [Variovorax sp. LjRoot130]|uniref:polysaccharide deacetylase family protein n=1 Tax=Variovorax sp. LjRoot130 TaxID=3342261 RepID=UPI003F51A2B4